MKRPSFQFYPSDWAANPNLKRCTFAEKGIWLEVMCLMHDQAEYGVLRWPLREIAEAVKCRPADLLALSRKGVLKGCDAELTDAFIYTPRSGRKDGEPVTLVPTQAGPIWYSSRMVKDEYVRTIRAESGPNGVSPKPPIGEPIGGPKGPRGSSSSSSPSGIRDKPASQAPARPPDEAAPQLALVEAGKRNAKTVPDCPHQRVLALWAEVLPALPQHDPEQWRGTRADHLRARWRETAAAKGWEDAEAGIAYLRKLFGYVGQSAFLTGRTQPAPGKRPFQVELEWLVNPTNWAKVIEGKYHQEAA